MPHITFNRAGQQALALALSAGLSSSVFAIALVEEGDWSIRWDNTFKYQAVFRTESPDEEIWLRSPSGDDRQPLFGESTRSFDRSDLGLVSNRLDWRTEFDVIWKETFGFRVSAAAWYDDIYNRDNDFPEEVGDPVANWNGLSYGPGEFSDDTEKWHGRHGEILDAFAFANWNVDEVYGNLRVGSHTIFYGNALLGTGAAHSVAGAMTQVNTAKGLGSPGTEAKELFMPSNKISTVIQLTPDLTLNAFYSLEWQRSRSSSPGAYWAVANGFTDDNEFSGLFPGVDGGPRAGVTQLDANEPDDAGSNYGLSLQYYMEDLDLETSFHYINTTKVQEGTLVGNIDFRKFVTVRSQAAPALAAVLNGWTQLGLASPADLQPIPLDSSNGPAVAIGDYQWVFADDIDVFGLSFAKEIAGLSIGMDITYFKEASLRADLNRTLFRFNNVPDTDPVAWLTNVQGLPEDQATALADSFAASGTTGNAALDTGLNGLAGLTAAYGLLESNTGFPVDPANSFDPADVGPDNSMSPRGDVYTVVLNGLGTLGDNALWDRGNYIFELTFSYLDKITENEFYITRNDGAISEGRISTHGVFIFRPVWNQVFPSVDLTVPISINYGFDGNSAIGAGFNKQGVFGIGTDFNYRNKWNIGLRYTNRFGSVDNSLAGRLKDRDNIALTVKATF